MQVLLRSAVQGLYSYEPSLPQKPKCWNSPGWPVGYEGHLEDSKLKLILHRGGQV